MALRKEEVENHMELLDQMFSEYHLDEYKAAWEAVKAENARMGAELMKNKVEVMGHGKGTAA